MQIIGLSLRDTFVITYLNVLHVVARPLSGLENFANGPYYAWSDPSRSLETRKDQGIESMIYLVRRMQEDDCMARRSSRIYCIQKVTTYGKGGGGSNRFLSSGRLPWKFAMLPCCAGCHNITVSRFGDDDDATNGCINVPLFHIFGKNDRYMNDL
jgi:hypothetical protein